MYTSAQTVPHCEGSGSETNLSKVVPTHPTRFALRSWYQIAFVDIKAKYSTNSK